MQDLTIIFLTVNKVPEGWAKYQKSILLEAIGGTPVITISKEPLDWGINLIQDEEPSVKNVYVQLLRGAKLAKTKYIAVAEDDCLYPECHFEYRPPKGEYGYNASRWGLHTWGEPVFYHKSRISNATLIAERKLVIKSLEERFSKYQSDHIGELGKERGTKLNRRSTHMFWTDVPMIYLSHVNALDPLEQSKRKAQAPIRAYDIPYWGKASDIVKKFI